MKLASRMSEASFCGRTELASHALSWYAQVLVAKLLRVLVVRVWYHAARTVKKEHVYETRGCEIITHVVV